MSHVGEREVRQEKPAVDALPVLRYFFDRPLVSPPFGVNVKTFIHYYKKQNKNNENKKTTLNQIDCNFCFHILMHRLYISGVTLLNATRIKNK